MEWCAGVFKDANGNMLDNTYGVARTGGVARERRG
jgi:hypothetical protein